jgi:acyl-coenzyme A thioesterase PaaI-like protein
VTARFDCGEIFQSYSGFIHGGIISLLLDGAMTNCMFSKNKKAVTGMLTVRYLHPVSINHMAVISARLVKSAPPLYYLEAEMSQEGKILVKGKGKFMDRTRKTVHKTNEP